MQSISYKRLLMNMEVEKWFLFLNSLISYFRKTSRTKPGGFSVKNQLETITLSIYYGQT